MFALLVLLAQVATPSPLATFAVPAGLPTAAPPVPGAPHVVIRRAPGPPPLSAGEAQISDSGSTNTAGYDVHLSADGSARVATGTTVVRMRVAHATAMRLFADLRAAGPLDALPAPACMKSASFGSTLTIAYRGRRSPDLSCAGDDARATTLANDAAAIARELKLGGIRGGPRRTL